MTDEGTTLQIKVIPRAGRSSLAGTRDGAYLVRLAAAPREGAANAELITFLADLLDLPKRQIAIVSGEKCRSKRVKVKGLAAAVIHERLATSNGR